MVERKQCGKDEEGFVRRLGELCSLRRFSVEIHVEIGMKKSRDLGGGKWLVGGQGPDPCLPAHP